MSKGSPLILRVLALSTKLRMACNGVGSRLVRSEQIARPKPFWLHGTSICYLPTAAATRACIAEHASFTALLRMRVELLYIRSSFLSKTATLFP